MHKKITLASISLLLFVACGGGGGGSSAENNTSADALTTQTVEQNMSDSEFTQALTDTLQEQKGITLTIAPLSSSTIQKPTQKSSSFDSSILIQSDGAKQWIANKDASQVVVTTDSSTKEILLTIDNSDAQAVETTADTSIFVTQRTIPSSFEALVNITNDTTLSTEQNIQNAVDRLYGVIAIEVPTVLGLGADWNQTTYIGETKSIHIATPNGAVLLQVTTPNKESVEITTDTNTTLLLPTTTEGGYTLTIPNPNANQADTVVGSYEVTKNPLFPVALKLISEDFNVSTEQPSLMFKGTPKNRLIVTYELETTQSQKTVTKMQKQERRYATFNAQGYASVNLALYNDGSYTIRYHQEAIDSDTGEVIAQTADEQFTMTKYTPEPVPQSGGSSSGGGVGGVGGGTGEGGF